MKITVILLLLLALSIGFYFNFFHKRDIASTSSLESGDAQALRDSFLEDRHSAESVSKNDRALYAAPYHSMAKDFLAQTSEAENDTVKESDDVWSRSDNINAALDELAIDHRWSRKERLTNSLVWAQACENSDSIRNTTASLEELMAVNVMLGYQKMFADVCQDLHIQGEIDLLGSFLDSDDFIDDPVDQLRLQLQRQLETFGEEDAISLAVELTKESVERMSESAITNVIGFLASNKLLDSITEDSSMNLNELYLSVVPEVTTALLCSKFKGCSAANSPVVLRQCIYRMSIGSGACYKPENIYDAIYQTLTPLEFIAFESFYRQIIAHENWRNH